MAKRQDPTTTPMMRQYLSVKESYPDAILFYRMGDFYEMFFDDAVIASEALDLTLTSRNKNDPEPVPMCGVPHHAALTYVAKLIDKGLKVAVCDQMEDPSKAKGLVKREVVRVITPGVVLDEENLDAKSNNYLAAVVLDQSIDSAAIAVLDASTYEFKGTRLVGLGGLAGEVYRLEPREIVVENTALEKLKGLRDLLPGSCLTVGDESFFEMQNARALLTELLGNSETDALAAGDSLLLKAAGAAAAYVSSTRPKGSLPISRFVRYEVSDHLVLDEATKAHLELVRTMSGEKKGSLLWLIDDTRTGMGARLIRRRINYPLCNVAKIRRRLDQVELFFRDAVLRSKVREVLGGLSDIERLAARVGMRAATPRDLGALLNSLKLLPKLTNTLSSCSAPDAAEILGGPIDRAEDLSAALDSALVPDPPTSCRDGGVFREGFNEILDDLTRTVRNAKDFIASLELRERKRTGIGSLKVSYNKVFGYYIEVTKANLKNVPPDYLRKQTMTTGERYITPELQDWEAKVLSADERKKELESELFTSLVEQTAAHVPRLLSIAGAIAKIDAATSLAETARKRDLVRPDVDLSGTIDIGEGRHPLVEALQPDTPFVPNDCVLDPEGERLLIITGPNMAGKSTMMRQVALTVILAQMGSFVPATRARIGICDRLFTRVGASDNIAKGASTFMVEMKETAHILRNATVNSLVILDEVGRGTSTYDGLSIAWAVGEYLHDAAKCKVMFATHYHELTDLAGVKDHSANYHVAAREYGEDVVFLRKLLKGGTSRSFGIQVAKMAGLPETVIQRAKEILEGLEKKDPNKSGPLEKAKNTISVSRQLDLFAPPVSKAEKVLQEIDLNRVTPLEALSLLSRLKDMTTKGD